MFVLHCLHDLLAWSILLCTSSWLMKLDNILRLCNVCMLIQICLQVCWLQFFIVVSVICTLWFDILVLLTCFSSSMHFVGFFWSQYLSNRICCTLYVLFCLFYIFCKIMANKMWLILLNETIICSLLEICIYKSTIQNLFDKINIIIDHTYPSSHSSHILYNSIQVYWPKFVEKLHFNFHKLK